MNPALPRAQLPPLLSGAALAMTVAVMYALCTLVWVLAPGPFLSFMNKLFHGMDFTSMVQPGLFAWTGFVSALLVQSAIAFFAGALFAGLFNRLTR